MVLCVKFNSRKYNKISIELDRDDGPGVFKNVREPVSEKMKKRQKQ